MGFPDEDLFELMRKPSPDGPGHVKVREGLVICPVKVDAVLFIAGAILFERNMHLGK